MKRIARRLTYAGTKQLKNSAVTTAKLKKEAVTGPKIKLATLRTVPSATNATNFSRYFTSGVKKASVGQTITLGTAAPFTVMGRCIDNGGGNFDSIAYLTTSAPDSYMYANYGDAYENGEFEPGEEAEIGYGANSTGTEWAAYNGSYSDWSAASPDGSVVLQGYSDEGVHVFGSDCAFDVTWTNNG